jgi:hypothetical protein
LLAAELSAAGATASYVVVGVDEVAELESKAAQSSSGACAVASTFSKISLG